MLVKKAYGTAQNWHMNACEKAYGTTQNWHMNACEKGIWDYTKFAHEQLLLIIPRKF
jgi:hypothetical protein